MQSFHPHSAANDTTEIGLEFDGDPADGDLTAQATRWAVRLTSGESTPEERRAFRRWRDENPAHAAALTEARRLWLSFGPSLAPARRAPLRFGRNVRIGGLAASLAICVALTWQSIDTWNHTYVTGPGERRAVALADGTRVLMNGRSALDVNFKNGAREVRLARGEAYFDVVHDAAHPFTVAAGAGAVRDIGTAFSVRRLGAGAAVVVARGEVEVDPMAPGAMPARLTPDEATAYTGKGAGPVQATNAEEALSWVRGRLVLEDRSLADSVGVINRYYAGKLVLLDGNAGQRRINAVIDLDRIDSWLAALDKTHAARVVRVGSLVLLY